jgi:hypothetical protein
VEMKAPQHEDELDARLREMFRSARALEPSEGFAARTMNAVRLEPLPAGRRALRHPWSAPVGWTVLVSAAAVITYGILVNEAIAARMLASAFTVSLHASAQFVRCVPAVLATTELFVTVGNALSRAAATRQGTTTLMLTVAVAATVLLALQRLLFSTQEESEWQELS